MLDVEWMLGTMNHDPGVSSSFPWVPLVQVSLAWH